MFLSCENRLVQSLLLARAPVPPGAPLTPVGRPRLIPAEGVRRPRSPRGVARGAEVSDARPVGQHS